MLLLGGVVRIVRLWGRRRRCRVGGGVLLMFRWGKESNIYPVLGFPLYFVRV